MVATRPSANPTIISLALKAVGTVLLVSSMLDYLVMLVPPQFGNAEWRFQFTTQFIDRGIIPLIGTSLIMLGLWIGGVGDRQRADGGVLKPITLGVMGVLGFLYLLMAPLHIIDAGKASASATRQLNNQTSQVEQQLEFRLEQERAQISGAIENPEALTAQFNEALNQEGISDTEKQRIEELKANLDRFRADPAALQTQQEQARNVALAEIQERNQAERNRISLQFNKSRLRVGLSGFALAASYLLIFWTGFRGGRR